jgi:hypothetical protein
MKILKVILTILILLIILSIPRIINWLLYVVIRILTIIHNTLSFFIKSVEEEFNKTQDGWKESKKN